MTPAQPAVPEPAALEPLADDAWLVRLGTRIDPDTNARVHALAAHIREVAPAWLRDLVPAYASLGVFFDLDRIDPQVVHDWLAAECSTLPYPASATTSELAARIVEIPVVYGGEFGPDLAEAAEALGMTAGALAARHASGLYTVAMIGFAPGFPYLSGLEPALALPRFATPRTRVPAGSVAIGGAQTGIYPRESPGGWRILGRTPLVLFDPQRKAPTTLLPGDRVRFRAIDAATFARMAAQA